MRNTKIVLLCLILIVAIILGYFLVKTNKNSKLTNNSNNYINNSTTKIYQTNSTKIDINLIKEIFGVELPKNAEILKYEGKKYSHSAKILINKIDVNGFKKSLNNYTLAPIKPSGSAKHVFDWWDMDNKDVESYYLRFSTVERTQVKDTYRTQQSSYVYFTSNDLNGKTIIYLLSV